MDFDVKPQCDWSESIMTNQPKPKGGPVTVTIELRSVDPHATPLPRRQRAPRNLPPNAPLPRKDEVVYLSSTSAWAVRLVVHEWISPLELHILIWLVYVGSTHYDGNPEFSVTQ